MDRASARPLEVISILNLPVKSDATVTVGDTEMPLIYNQVSQLHHFAVPIEAIGETKVNVPAEVTGAKAVSLQLIVLPLEFAGSTSEEAVAQINNQFDELQVTAALALDELDSINDSSLVNLMNIMSDMAERFQEKFAALDDEGQRYILGLYFSNESHHRLVVSEFKSQIEALRNFPSIHPIHISEHAQEADNTLHSYERTANAVSRPFPSVDSLARKCNQANLQLEAINKLAFAADYYSFALPTIILLGKRDPILSGAVADFLGTLSFALDAAVVLQSLIPNFFHPEGLRLKTLSSRIGENEKTGKMRAYLNIVNVRGALASTVEISGKLGNFRQKYEKIKKNRILSKSGALMEALEAVVKKDDLEKILDGFGLLDQLYDNKTYFTITGGEQRISFDNLEIRDINSTGLWQFTSPAVGGMRTFETIGDVPENLRPYVSVALSSTAVRGENCTAKTATPDPTSGLNGFLITTEGSIVSFSQTTDLIELQSGETKNVTFHIMNEGFEDSGTLTYAIGSPYDAEYAGITVSAPQGPSSLVTGRSGTIRFQVGARLDAPSRTSKVPLVVYEDGDEVLRYSLGVIVYPQLSSIIVSEATTNITLRDFGSEDGDFITITLNGSNVVDGHRLTNAGTTFSLKYRQGINVLTIKALNEGNLSPNTAEITFGDITSGEPAQQYGLLTGQSVRVQITLDPNTVKQKAERPLALPSAKYLRCAQGWEGVDCLR